MPLFERNYRAAATAELERTLRELEEKDKIAQTKVDFDKEASLFQSNLTFAERLNLVTSVQADAMRERVLKAELGYRHSQRTETRDDIVDDIENPLERAKRYQSMEKYNAEIAKARAEQSSDPNSSTGRETPSITSITEERMK